MQPSISGDPSISGLGNLKRQTKRALLFDSDESDSNGSVALADDFLESSLQLPVGEEAPDNENALCIFCEGAFTEDCAGEVRNVFHVGT